jgi:hypothetical protein
MGAFEFICYKADYHYQRLCHVIFAAAREMAIGAASGGNCPLPFTASELN